MIPNDLYGSMVLIIISKWIISKKHWIKTDNALTFDFSCLEQICLFNIFVIIYTVRLDSAFPRGKGFAAFQRFRFGAE